MTAHQADPELVGLVRDYFSQTFTAEVIGIVERDGMTAPLWESAAELGLPLVGIAERCGGSGGSLPDLLTVLQGAGRYAVPLPLAETSLAAWLLAHAGAKIPAGPMTVVPHSGALSLDGGRLTGTAAHVPWVRGATHVVAVLPTGVVVIDVDHLHVTAGSDLAGMPRDAITANGTEVDFYPAEVSADDVLLRGALLRSAQIAGAITGAYELTTTYVGQREQFGRPIGKFQSVQAHVVELAQLAALTALSVDRAAVAGQAGAATFEIVATKALASRNAGLAARAAHQAHGAIGMTQEYALQLLTRRLHTWRGDFGDEASMNVRLGAAMTRAGNITKAVTADGSTIGV
jgi:acyl-CoA dehydrogenase